MLLQGLLADNGMGMKSKHSRGGQIPCCSIGCTVACHTESKNRPIRLLAAPPGGRGKKQKAAGGTRTRKGNQAPHAQQKETKHQTTQHLIAWLACASYAKNMQDLIRQDMCLVLQTERARPSFSRPVPCNSSPSLRLGALLGATSREVCVSVRAANKTAHYNKLSRLRLAGASPPSLEALTLSRKSSRKPEC